MNITCALTIVGPAFLVFLTTKIYDRRKKRKALAAAKKKHEAQVELLRTQLLSRVKTLETAVDSLAHNNRELKRVGEMKSKFMSIVAHDLKQPLTSISGYASVLLGDDAYKSDKKILENILKATANMNRLMSDLVDASIIESGRLNIALNPFTFNDLVTEAYNQYRVIAGQKNISFRKMDLPDMVGVKGDKFRINQVISNLLNNAFKFTPEGGTVEIRYYTEGSILKTIISDNGSGIAPLDRVRIFEKFQQAETLSDDSRKMGWGLGLSIAYDIVLAHNGAIGVDSAGLGKGSTFWFTLPL